MADPFSIADLRGGINNSDSPTLLADNQIVDARNVDLRDGALGSKRRGTAIISMAGSIFDSPVIALIRHTPTNLTSGDELWGIDQNGHVDRRVAGVWQGGVARANTNVTISAANYDANGVSLHGKLFLAALSGVNRLPVWDGTVLRWAGFNQTPVPGVANTAVAGGYTGTRYVRVRYVQQSAGIVIRRSEPSTSVTFTPTGLNSGIIITKDATTEGAGSIYAEAQTHWEVELSTDNVLFYRIATVAIGAPTYTDTLASSAYSAFPLSEAIGEYVPPGAARHVAVDEDRLIFGGSHVFPSQDSKVWWTPVNDDDGVGNDERIPTATSQFLNFDGLDGGAVTAIVAGVSGSVTVFKRERTHKMVRTGNISAAYDPVTVSPTRGALPRAAVGGTDPTGVPCVYFLDQNVGLCRYGQRGIEDRLADPVRVTWKTRNKKATIAARIVYYRDLEQVWYAVATGASTTPDLLFMHETRYSGNFFHNGVPATARAMALFPNATTDTLKPVLGMASTASSYIHEADTGVNDAGTSFKAYVTTKPYALGALWRKFGLMACVLLARATTGTTLAIRTIRNFGVEVRDITADLSPVGTEDHVIRPIDNATMSELNTVQLTYGDSAASDQAWSIDQFAFKVRAEDSSA
jgi:hypothetical protein